MTVDGARDRATVRNRLLKLVWRSPPLAKNAFRKGRAMPDYTETVPNGVIIYMSYLPDCAFSFGRCCKCQFRQGKLRTTSILQFDPRITESCYKSDLISESVADCERDAGFFNLFTCTPINSHFLSTVVDVPDVNAHGADCVPKYSKLHVSILPLCISTRTINLFLYTHHIFC